MTIIHIMQLNAVSITEIIYFLYIFIGRPYNDNVVLELPRQIATTMDSGVSSCLLMLHTGICPLDGIKFPMGLDAYSLGNESFSNNQKTPSMSYFRHVSFDDSWEKSDSIYTNAPTPGQRNSRYYKR